MRPLTAADPESVGGHRLLARIGAGGMGVVYLGRSDGGALAAVKVIRAEHAADPGFRARFRREAAAAARVDGRWTTPVTAADPEAAGPWIATAFVPGPSLAETVGGYGPLPPATVRALGARLADALAAVHAAGLVHRDVKPGNVLLALDGPRLIDFGIARASGATALTASDVIVGTPGYLSPEQARARAEEVGPPSDVFSLGCLLGYAASGRPPFGSGGAVGALYRTIHEAPDLDGVPDDALRTLIARCLAKDPADRPTVAQLRADLGGSGSGTDDWLPPGLPAMIAERSAQVLNLPEPERPAPTEPASQQPGPPERSVSGRRRLLLLGASTVGVLAAGGGGAWLVGRRSGAGASGPRPTRTVAVQADLTGPGKALGTAVVRGVRLAAEQHNARADRRYDLALTVLDDRGEADRAKELAKRLVAAGTACAVVGPTSDATALAVRDIYNGALVPMVTAWAGAYSLYGMNSVTEPAVFQVRPPDYAMAPPLVHYLGKVSRATRTALIDDRATPDYSWQLAQALTRPLSSAGSVRTYTVAADADDFASVAAQAARAQAVVYCGSSPRRAAACARALRSAGFTGTPAASEPVLGPGFLDAAGAAAEDWVFATTFVDPARMKSAAGFVTSFRRRYGVQEAGRGAAEAYDAAGLLAKALTGMGTGQLDTGSLAHRLRALKYHGVTRTFAFRADTGAAQVTTGLFLWRVANGVPWFLGQYEEVRAGSGSGAGSGGKA
ncbi:bifunctional serine/threonine-protein kinase/ABC transporter substrate-binding protein [Streptomyces sp. NPDC006012]|uniref:bifunctional serine/threonine-protein kinase/ABC transporter substrate-binding protein n=1 Tax=Streptomyces sp. NPDC006012 TaxID=3364739 RepID=UPI0036A6C5FD